MAWAALSRGVAVLDVLTTLLEGNRQLARGFLCRHLKELPEFRITKHDHNNIKVIDTPAQLEALLAVCDNVAKTGRIMSERKAWERRLVDFTQQHKATVLGILEQRPEASTAGPSSSGTHSKKRQRDTGCCDGEQHSECDAVQHHAAPVLETTAATAMARGPGPALNSLAEVAGSFAAAEEQRSHASTAAAAAAEDVGTHLDAVVASADVVGAAAAAASDVGIRLGAAAASASGVAGTAAAAASDLGIRLVVNASSQPSKKPRLQGGGSRQQASTDSFQCWDAKAGASASRLGTGSILGCMCHEELGSESEGYAMPSASTRLLPGQAVGTSTSWASFMMLPVRDDVNGVIDRSKLKFPTDKCNRRFLLGTGSFGNVYKAMYEASDRLLLPVAVKELRAGLPKGTDNGLQRELELLCRLSHPNIVTVYGGNLEGSRPYVVAMLCHCDLGALLQQQVERCLHLDLQSILKISVDIFQGLMYLHGMGIVHRDLKPANVLLDEEGVAKIADFGLARFQASSLAGDGTFTAVNVGTVQYRAPECFGTAGGSVASSSDVYSAGMIMAELVNLEAPWLGLTHKEVEEQVAHEFRPPIGECPPDLRALIEDCWKQEPAARPNAADVLESLRSMQHPAQGQ